MSKEIPFEKLFASHEKAKYWSDKNLLKPNEVALNSNKKYWFCCNICSHEFDMTLNNVNSGYWCPYCINKLCDKDDCNQCFEKSFASNDKSKYWSDKNELKPRQKFKNSHNKYWFNCNCGHEFEIVLSHISRGSWCSYCSIPPKKLCDGNDCIQCFEKSFASHNKANYWSNKNSSNPRQIFKSTQDKYWFNCDCGHEFESGLNHITSNKWCPYCCNPPLKLCIKTDCNQCFEKSFASHEKSSCWSDKNKLKPRQVFKNGHNKYIFNCVCGHEFKGNLYNIIKGIWCSYCANPARNLCDKENCNQCFEKSFASHDKSKYWSDKNISNPRQVFKSTRNKYWFKCNNEHIFTTALYNVVNNCWCPYCVNKTEQKLYTHLQPIYTNLQQQYKVDWCKNITYLPFDFILEEQKIIIELDGLQHFEQVSNWVSPYKVQERDKYKMKQANDNGYSVIRILQEDVFYDTYQWLEELKTNIEKLVSENKVQNIFMCKDNEYSIFEVLE